VDIRSSADQAQNKPPAPPSRRRRILRWYAALVLIWAAGGLSAWTGLLQAHPSGQPEIVGLALAPFGILTWPAHEAALYMEGKGPGANALCQFSIGSLLTFVLWSAILWSPLLLRLRTTIPLRLIGATQVLLLLLTFALFWKYGNG